MTTAEKRTALTAMTGEANADTLSTYLSLAEEDLKAYAYPVTTPPEGWIAEYDGIHLQMTAFLLNKRGAEGEVIHDENGVSRRYEDGGYPRTLLRRITPHGGVVG